ncbi:MAG TPA: Ig-like domain-containing protein, partial [Chitinophagaceae bacterium]
MIACNKGSDNSNPAPPPANLTLTGVRLNGEAALQNNYNVNTLPAIRFQFSTPVDRSTVMNSIVFTTSLGNPVSYSTTYQNNDSVVIIQPLTNLNYLTRYFVSLRTSLKSAQGKNLQSGYDIGLITQIDSTDKFPQISDTALIELVQQQTFKYFWDFAHPVSGLARERNTSGDIVTSGGSGFGIMAIVTGIHRNFITRQQGLTRMQTIVSFLKNTAQMFHGAFPHWLNGSTGAVVPFSANDNGADLVETSFLIQGLLTARQYFNSSDAAEVQLRSDINNI